MVDLSLCALHLIEIVYEKRKGWKWGGFILWVFLDFGVLCETHLVCLVAWVVARGGGF